MDFERVILGECIARPEYLADCLCRLKADDFSDDERRIGWNLLVEMSEANRPVDIETVAEEIEKKGVDSVRMLAWVNEYEAADGNAQDRLEKFIDRSDRAYGYNKLRVLLEDTKTGKVGTAPELLDGITGIAEDISKRHTQGDSYVGDTILGDYDEIHRSRKETFKFGLAEVDAIMERIPKKNFILIAARPGAGKSAIMLYPVIELVKSGGRACVVTLEMERSEVMLRMIANISGVTMNRINGTEPPTMDDEKAITSAIVLIKSWKLSVLESGVTTIRDIERLLAKAKAKGDPIRLLCIDHFGLLQAVTPKKSRYEEYTEISNTFKRIAKQYGCTVICLCQLNRLKDSYEEPGMEHLRDTGSLEQDADKILFLHRDRDSKDITHLTLAKNRQGTPDMKCDMRFIGSLMRFTRC